MHVCGLSRAQLMAAAHRPVPSDELDRLFRLLARRCLGEPVAYLTGRREFWSLPLEVSVATLIPRPETELLVERALALVPPNARRQIVDLGTGCGAIALALARERPRCRIVATDISRDALALARRNASRLGIANVEFALGDWFDALSGRRLRREPGVARACTDAEFDVVLSNPPYVRRGDPCLQQGDLRFEPIAALAAGPEGLDAIRRIALHARRHLKRGGSLLLEHGATQAETVAALLRRSGYRDIVRHLDLAGQDRVVEAHWPSA